MCGGSLAGKADGPRRDSGRTQNRRQRRADKRWRHRLEVVSRRQQSEYRAAASYRWAMRMCTGAVLVVVTTVLCVVSVSAAQPVGRASRVCRVPRLTGLTLSVARQRVAHAGCALRVKGTPLEGADVQTIERQSPAGGRRSGRVTVWLNPFCEREAEYGPEIKEPVVTAGPTKLVTGFYLEGGPVDRRFSTPHCKLPEPAPGAGSVDVIDPSGVTVATKTSAQGHFVEIALPAGSYTIRGTFLNATINGVHPIHTQSVVIPAGHTVRQDFILSIP